MSGCDFNHDRVKVIKPNPIYKDVEDWETTIYSLPGYSIGSSIDRSFNWGNAWNDCECCHSENRLFYRTKVAIILRASSVSTSRPLIAALS